ncbi:MAG: C10 family peptidase [Bacteroidales bacterium]|nr:C10 family peptidase [Bacteroidales bacterium]
MKKLILCLSALLCLLPLNAAEVTPQRAMAAAEAFFGATKAQGLHFIDCAATKSGAKQSFYIIGRDSGGFVIISASDKVKPVLAYSSVNSFDPDRLPPALQLWMDYTAAALEDEESGDADAASAWQKITPAAEAALHELKTPAWGQYSPFNDLCPSVGGTRCEAGCVATSLAEIMCFYDYPDKGSGTLPSYYDPVRGVTQEGHALGTVYNWVELKKLSDKAKVQAASDKVKANLAGLFWDLGIMMQMQYSTEGSGSYTAVIIGRMGEYMGFNKAARMEHKDLYPFETWCSMLRSEIDKSQPILYDGQDVTHGGHAFVIDGYSEQDIDMFCINWGWDGKDNGVFRFWRNFPSTQGAIFDLKPDPSGSSKTPDGDIYLQSSDRDKTPSYGITLTHGTITRGNTFYLDIGQITNSGTAPYSASLRFDLVDINGKVRQEGINTSNIEIVTEPPYSYHTVEIPCRLTVEPGFGDKIIAMHRSRKGGAWKKLEGLGDGSTVAELPVFPQIFIDIKQTYAPREKVALCLVNNDRPWIYNVYMQQFHTVWTVYSSDGKQLAQIDNSADQWSTNLYFEVAGEYLLVARIYDKSGALTDTVCAPVIIK